MSFQIITNKTTIYLVKILRNLITKSKPDFVKDFISKSIKLMIFLHISIFIIIIHENLFYYSSAFFNSVFSHKLLAFSEKFIDIKEIKPVVFSDGKIVTNLDGLYECILYLSLKYESDCIGKKKLITYSILFLVRERFQETIGISEEISRRIISGEWESLVSEEELKNANILSKYGISLNKISDELRRVKLLNEKLTKNFFTDITALREIAKNMYVEPIFADKSKQKGESSKTQDLREAAAYELLKTLVSENIRVVISDK